MQMYIGGFAKNTLIDFPGTVACMVFTQGCNFHCPYCHNPELVAGPRKAAGDLLDPEGILEFLEKRKGLLDGVAITGGEPCLQKDLAEFCSAVKNMGYKVKLDSNGSFPQILEQLFDRELIDYLAMDIKTDPDAYTLAAPASVRPRQIRQSIELVMERAPAYEFRTTCCRPFVSDEILDRIGKMISGASRYCLAKCSRNVKVLDSDFVKSDNHFFTDKEMKTLKSVIEPYVKEVILR